MSLLGFHALSLSGIYGKFPYQEVSNSTYSLCSLVVQVAVRQPTRGGCSIGELRAEGRGSLSQVRSPSSDVSGS